MANIGQFTKSDTGFRGIIETLTFTASVTIEPIENKRSPKSPDYRVYARNVGTAEIGAAWIRESENADYLSVQIDDPSFSAPLNCRLIHPDENGSYILVWERKTLRR
jgi:uncharacterized protein (DUF736 family)